MPQSPSPSSSSEADFYAAAVVAHTAWRACVVDELRGPEWEDLSITQHLQWMNAAEAVCHLVAATPPSLPIDFKQASELLEMFGGEAGMVTLSIAEGHSGRGLYAHSSGYTEDGAEFLGVADEEAVPGKQASEQGGWQLVPTIGARVKADHPITVLNPSEYFTISEMRMDSDGRISARGEETCWFSVRALAASPSPHPEEGALLLGGDEGAPSKSLNAKMADVLRPLLKPGQKVIWRQPSRWHDDNGVLSNHYDGMSIAELAEVFGYDYDWELAFEHAAIVWPKNAVPIGGDEGGKAMGGAA